MILFLSKYPHTKEEFRDGFYQRVMNIDSFFENDERVYLDIHLYRNIKKVKFVENKRKEYSCNFFIHFFFIISLFRKANLVYIQSLHNVLYSFVFIKMIKNIYVLDLHGVVPEEIEFQGYNFKSKFFDWLESIVFPKLDICIAVTDRLARHYMNKFPYSKAKYIVYTILPNNLDNNKEDNNTKEDEILKIVYSGNTQAWQNIDLMLKTISENISKNIEYTILTGDLEGMTVLLNKYQLTSIPQVRVFSVQPSELSTYYENSHYGFVLRDDIVVNNVACPTKLVEYLNYGIIPIVLSDQIGDFKELGYEYVSVSNFDLNLPIRKSEINKTIIKELKKKNDLNIKFRIEELLN